MAESKALGYMYMRVLRGIQRFVCRPKINLKIKQKFKKTKTKNFLLDFSEYTVNYCGLFSEYTVNYCDLLEPDWATEHLNLLLL